MTALQCSLQDLLATWDAWSSHATIISAADEAAARGDHGSADSLRALLPTEPAPAALGAVTAAAELIRLLSVGWVRAVDAALTSGASWSDIGDIGTATSCSAERARADHGSGAVPRQRNDLADAASTSGSWLTTAQAAARARRHTVTVNRAATTGLLHGHQPIGRDGRTVPGFRWTFAPRTVDAWAQGLDERAERAACGCDQLASPRRARGAR